MKTSKRPSAKREAQITPPSATKPTTATSGLARKIPPVDPATRQSDQGKAAPNKRPGHVPHAVDELERVEPILDAKLKALDPRKLGKLRRIARLERDLCGEEPW